MNARFPKNQKQFSHFLLTRFNLSLWKQDKLGNKVRTELWLKERFMLFEKYCLPSVAGQTCKDFLWFVLFDENTPQEYRQKIAEYQNQCNQFVPFFLNRNETQNYMAFFSVKIKEMAAPNCKYIISTRLDNDDALNINYINSLQQEAGNTLLCNSFSEFCISFTWGCQYFEKWNFAEQIRFPNNHFISLVSSNSENALPRCIYEIGHLNVEKLCPTIKINKRKDAQWLEIIHKSNASNDVKVKNLQFPVLRTTDMKAFALPGIKLVFWKNLFNFFIHFIPQMLVHTFQHNRLFGTKTNEVK
jgi:hypothetical protein